MGTTSAHAARVLDLFGEVTHENVQRARHELAMKYHPDRFRDTEGATRHMVRINAATDTLIADLKVQAVSDPRCARTDNPVSCETNTVDKNSVGSKAFNRNPAATNSEGHTTTHNTVFGAGLHAQERALRGSKKPRRPSAPSGADFTLSCMASASYSNVLCRSIGTINTGLSVDIRA